MSTFMPTDPHDWAKTQAQKKAWEAAEGEAASQRRLEKQRFVINVTISGLAALAAVVGVIIQLVKG